MDGWEDFGLARYEWRSAHCHDGTVGYGNAMPDDPKPASPPPNDNPPSHSGESRPLGDVFLGEGKAVGVKPIMMHPDSPGMPAVPDAPQAPVNVAPPASGGSEAPGGDTPQAGGDAGSSSNE